MTQMVRYRWILSTSVRETLRQLLNVQRCVRHALNQCDYLLCEKWKIIDCARSMHIFFMHDLR